MISKAKTISRLVFVGTYPPRRCGIATFTQDLLQNIRLLLPNIQFEVCALNKSILDDHAYPDEVVITIDQDNQDSYLQAADKINEKAEETIVVIQHEYGIYGNDYGRYLVPFLKAIKSPIVTSLHTVLENPPPAMRKITAEIIRRSDRIVVLTRSSYDILSSQYPRSKAKLKWIEHGIHPRAFEQPDKVKPQLKLSGRRVLMTFGLLSRNKGIEYVIRTLPAVATQFPDVLYLVIGETHPDVTRHEGEAYRIELRQLVDKLGMQKHVRFIGDYLPLKTVLLYLQATDIYIAPSLDPQQAVSGTLSYALGAGCAVVSTDFAQARELVKRNIGRVVPVKDSMAIERSVISLFKKPKDLESMRQSAYASTRSMLWSNVADNYLNLFTDLAAQSGRNLNRWPVFALSHLGSLTDSFGLIQFAEHTAPRRNSGYTLDDNSRALQTVSSAARSYPELGRWCNRLAEKYLKTMETCLSQDPQANYLSAKLRRPTNQNFLEDLRDSKARAYYSLQIAACSAGEIAPVAQKLLKKLPSLPESPILRPIAFYLLGACTAFDAGNLSMLPAIDRLAGRLIRQYRKTAVAGWKWFEPTMTYANGQLCAALLEAARCTNSNVYQKVGLEALAFLRNTCFMGEVYVPIGQDGWYARGQQRALFDQQPEDVLAFMQATGSAYRLTGHKRYLSDFHKAFTWFLGNNLMGLRIYDDESGGCHDGLMPTGVNNDEGAESTLAYLQARLMIERVELS